MELFILFIQHDFLSHATMGPSKFILSWISRKMLQPRSSLKVQFVVVLHYFFYFGLIGVMLFSTENRNHFQCGLVYTWEISSLTAKIERSKMKAQKLTPPIFKTFHIDQNPVSTILKLATKCVFFFFFFFLGCNLCSDRQQFVSTLYTDFKYGAATATL